MVIYIVMAKQAAMVVIIVAVVEVEWAAAQVEQAAQ